MYKTRTNFVEDKASSEIQITFGGAAFRSSRPCVTAFFVFTVSSPVLNETLDETETLSRIWLNKPPPPVQVLAYLRQLRMILVPKITARTAKKMEIEEPIEQLLRCTGWSCEDLLAKLQHYKSTKANEQVTPHEEDKEDASVLVKENVDSTDEINVSENIEMTNLECTTDNYQNRQSTNSLSKCISIGEEFSDTDEEEEEVNATSSSIINEIIDDISSSENLEEIPTKDSANPPPSNKEDDDTEVTEVRVIQINEEDEDDSFDEDFVSHCVADESEIVDLGTNPQKIQPTEDDRKDIDTIDLTLDIYSKNFDLIKASKRDSDYDKALHLSSSSNKCKNNLSKIINAKESAVTVDLTPNRDNEDLSISKRNEIHTNKQLKAKQANDNTDKVCDRIIKKAIRSSSGVGDEKKQERYTLDQYFDLEIKNLIIHSPDDNETFKDNPVVNKTIFEETKSSEETTICDRNILENSTSLDGANSHSLRNYEMEKNSSSVNIENEDSGRKGSENREHLKMETELQKRNYHPRCS
ncbi:hypothetical protein NQ317_013186 [Molorchus minor]|uniref:Uncharacterized protein n=1 Tax=Molorchus minor TaxID=1323400 RepID=A0ABQ9J2Y7_9CUCU|nr:hypothetical protein NQ317_013186 [Molorchus minor]